MQRGKPNTAVAGIDVGKRWLDAAVHGLAAPLRAGNDAAGLQELLVWLQTHDVGRVGLEASGGYERALIEALEQAGMEVVLHQPLEVRLFARLKRLKAKSDRIDAILIAAATAQVEAVKAAADPRLRELAERLTAYEHVADQLARLKTFMEQVPQTDLIDALGEQMRSLKALKAKLAAEVQRRIAAHQDLLARHRLLMSLPGVGPVVAAALLARMPELGRMKRGQAAALLGVAPFDRDSGQFRGQRFIGGGRARPRRLVYLAALKARHHDPAFKAAADQLLARGKPKKVVLVAVMRRLIEAANLVLSRQQPWDRRAVPLT